MRKARVSMEIVGKYVGKTVYGEGARSSLVRKGTVLSAATVRALARRGIESVWISDEVFPDFEVQEVVRHETREVARLSLQSLAKSLAAGTKAAPAQAKQMISAVRSLVEEICANDDVVANISHLRAWDNYTFEHSVQVAVISVLLGKRMLMTEDQLLRLGTGAILHDVGKIAVPQEILQKPGRLTAEEFEIVKAHSRVGWDLVHDGFPSIMPTSSIVVLQHHERLDGSGYPSGLKAEQIYVFSKIAAVADVFDAVRAERNYRQNYSPRQVVRIMQEESGNRLDAGMTQLLLQHVAVVSEGEVVRLTNGLLGMVVGQNPGEPLRPRVVVVADDQDQPIARHELDLKDSMLQIEQILPQWPQGVVAKLAQEEPWTKP